MEASKALRPLEFRFTDPADIAIYGDRWYRFSEADLIRTPARQLVELETELGMPIVDAMNGMRMSSTLGDLAGSWIGVRNYDPKLAGSFDDFNPMTLAITWRAAQDEVDLGKGFDQVEDTQPPPADGFPGIDPSRSATSAPTDSVVLPTLPVTG